MKEIKNRIDFLYVVDVKNGNPNGDPDGANCPRQDTETGNGIITDVCIKRKIRNYVDMVAGNKPGYEIFISDKAVLNRRQEDVENSEAVTSGKKDLAQALCEKYYDIRTMGAVLTNGGNHGQLRGPLQIGIGESVEPIMPVEMCITRCAVTKEEDENKERTMGRKSIVPYGLYVIPGFISANLAQQTGFNQDDLDLLFDALTNMFDHDRSAARGLMSAQKLIVFEHDSVYGNAPAHKLFELVTITRKPDVEVARSIKDYDITIDEEHLPKGVTIKRVID